MCAIPLSSKYSIVVAEAFENIVNHFGSTDTLLTDQGTEFTGKSFQNMLKKYDISHITTTAYHPKTNGLVEKANGTLADMLSKVLNRKEKEWDRHLLEMVWAYNRTPQDSTNMTPYLLHFNRQPAGIGKSILSKARPCIFECGDDFLSDCALQKLYMERARTANEESKRRQTASYTRLYKTKDGRFVVGDRVLLFAPNLATNKLSQAYAGPYLINNIRDSTAYITLISKPGNLKAVHFDRLSLCYPELPNRPSPRSLPIKSGEVVDEGNGP